MSITSIISYGYYWHLHDSVFRLDLNNTPYIVSFVVNRVTNEIDFIDVLYSENAKKEPAALLPEITDKSATLTDSTISISKLLEYVNKYFPDILPEDVLKHFGHDARPSGNIGESALYQERTPEYTSRQLLVSALEHIDNLPIADKNRIEIYKTNMEKYAEKEAELNEINKQINKIAFTADSDRSQLGELYSHSFLNIFPISSRIFPYISCLRYLVANTMWYLQFHVVCAKLFLSFIGCPPFI